MDSQPHPATFGRRFAAGLIDFVVIAALVFALGHLCSISKSIALYLVVPLALIGFTYTTVGHARYGQTVGKHFLDIRVIHVNGSAIGWNEALRRSSVDGVLGAIWASGLLLAALALNADSFQGQGWTALYKLMMPLFPAYVLTMLSLSHIWGWSEFVTMLLNRERRALHDFLGSTRVVHGT